MARFPLVSIQKQQRVSRRCWRIVEKPPLYNWGQIFQFIFMGKKLRWNWNTRKGLIPIMRSLASGHRILLNEWSRRCGGNTSFLTTHVWRFLTVDQGYFGDIYPIRNCISFTYLWVGAFSSQMRCSVIKCHVRDNWIARKHFVSDRDRKRKKVRISKFLACEKNNLPKAVLLLLGWSFMLFIICHEGPFVILLIWELNETYLINFLWFSRARKKAT